MVTVILGEEKVDKIIIVISPTFKETLLMLVKFYFIITVDI